MYEVLIKKNAKERFAISNRSIAKYINTEAHTDIPATYWFGTVVLK